MKAQTNQCWCFSGNVPYFWTSGRLCDFDGCDRPDFFPKNINGWFWSANQARLSPTNGSAFHDWSGTGGFSPPRPQPDNREQIQQVGYFSLPWPWVPDIIWFEGSYFTARSEFSGYKYISRTVRQSPAWQCWTTSTGTGSSGTTLGATTRSQSSVKTWRDTSSLPGRPSPISASPEGSWDPQSSLRCYLFIVLFMTLLIIQQCGADQMGTIPKYDEGKNTLSKLWLKNICIVFFYKTWIRIRIWGQREGHLIHQCYF